MEVDIEENFLWDEFDKAKKFIPENISFLENQKPNKEKNRLNEDLIKLPQKISSPPCIFPERTRLDELKDLIEKNKDLLPFGNAERKKLMDTKIPTKHEKEKQIKKWLKYRNQVYGLPNIDVNHICTFNCTLSKSITTIDAKLNLYGCIKSGKYHLCNQSIIKCPCTFLNKDGTITCIFSGIDVGVIIDDNMFKKVDTGKDEYNINFHFHENKKMRIEMGKNGNDFPFLPDNDNDNESFEYEEGEYTIQNWVDSSANRRKQKSKQRQCFTNINDPNLWKDTESIIYDLLYNTKERSRIDKIRVNEMKNSAINSIHKHYKKCKRNKLRPIRHHLEKIYNNEMNKKRRMRPLKFNQKQLKYYSNINVNLWKIVINTEYCAKNKSKFHIKQHTIATLYVLQTGLFMNNNNDDELLNQNQNQILPRDDFLYNELPHENNLKEWKSCHTKKWNYNKGDITKGRNNLKLALNSITNKNQQNEIMKIMQKITNNNY